MTVKVMDRGYDFDVEFPDEIPLIEAGTHEFAVGPYLVEVRWPTSDSVRLTPAQARVASTSDNFILCVVDLRKCAGDRLEQPWAAKDVEPLALMVFDFRDLIAETHNLVDTATNRTIAIRNEAQLRYAVPSEIWEDGIPILEWVKRIASTLKI